MILLSRRKPGTIYIIVHLYSSAEITAFAISYVFFFPMCLFFLFQTMLQIYTKNKIDYDFTEDNQNSGSKASISAYYPQRKNTANGLRRNYIHFVHTSELLCFLRITQSEHMWNIATSLHCLINPCRQKNAGGRKANVRVFHLVTAKSGNSTPFEQQMPVRLGNTLLNECASCVKYQVLILNIFGHNLKVSIL